MQLNSLKDGRMFAGRYVADDKVLSTRMCDLAGIGSRSKGSKENRTVATPLRNPTAIAFFSSFSRAIRQILKTLWKSSAH